MTRPQAVVVGCSTGAVHALRTLAAGLDARLPVPLVVVCHAGEDFDIELLAELLRAQTPLAVTEARERHAPVPGAIHLAPAGYHLLIEADGCFGLSVDEPVCHCRPAVDVLFETAAHYYRQALVGVVLTGANDDGARGLAAIRERGGIAIVQDPADALATAMPEAALRRAGADHVTRLDAIAPLLNRLCLK